ncbi:hypothetical protein RUM44_001948 [Polyplax serrata]|uniref:Uncharacterized protein n=1 Tax=Polyplax serrata TaxID=468196 RepID=A0ABR1ALH4_POLSC
MDETSSNDQRANTRPPRISMSRRLVKVTSQPNSCRAEYYKLEKARVLALRVKIQSTSNLHADPSTEKLGLQRINDQLTEYKIPRKENIQPISRDDNHQHEDMIQQDVRRVAKLNKSSTSTRGDEFFVPTTNDYWVLCIYNVQLVQSNEPEAQDSLLKIRFTVTTANFKRFAERRAAGNDIQFKVARRVSET